MSTHAQQHDAAVLLRTEHAVARVLAEAADAATAYRRLLGAIATSLGWEVGALWIAADDGDGTLRCVETWQGPEPFEQTSRSLELAPGEGLPGRVWASGEPAWIVDAPDDSNFPRAVAARRAGLRAAFCAPLRSSSGVVGAIEFFARELREPDDELLASMAVLGSQIGGLVARRRAERSCAALEPVDDPVARKRPDSSVLDEEREPQWKY
jgi:signal transduction protein with GAF and PtsI domain